MKERLTISETAQRLGVSIQTLRRWHKLGKFSPSFVTPGGHRQYLLSDLERLQDRLFQQAESWAKANKDEAPILPKDLYCQTSQIFQYRLDRLSVDIIGHLSPDQGALVVAVVGEIGNNSFDHNLGNWLDVPGIFFGYDLGKKEIVLADRGQGILKTLRRVRPSLRDSVEALRTAFFEVLSGRAPESRGNGLKFVRKVVKENRFRLVLQSGNAQWSCVNGEEQLITADENVPGVLARIQF